MWLSLSFNGPKRLGAGLALWRFGRSISLASDTDVPRAISIENWKPQKHLDGLRAQLIPGSKSRQTSDVFPTTLRWACVQIDDALPVPVEEGLLIDFLIRIREEMVVTLILLEFEILGSAPVQWTASLLYVLALLRLLDGRSVHL